MIKETDMICEDCYEKMNEDANLSMFEDLMN